MYESAIEEMLAAAWDARTRRNGCGATSQKLAKNWPATWAAMLAAARAVADRRINEISEQWKGCAESLAMFLAPYPRNRVRKGLTWADAWESRKEFPWLRSPGHIAGVRIDSLNTINADFAANRDFEVSTSSDFSGEQVND